MPTILRAVLLLMFVAASVLTCSASELSDAELELLRDGFDARRDRMLQSQVDTPYPPAGPDTNEHLLVWSKLDFALAAFYLDVDVDRANQAVIEATRLSRVSLQSAETYRDLHFHWEMPLYSRIYEYFGSQSRYFPGRLSDEAAEAIREIAWEWASIDVRIEDAELSTVWYSWGSENHGAMRVCSLWGAAKIFLEDDDYRNRLYSDGSSPEEQFSAWTAFIKLYLRERIGKGLLVEFASPTYAKYTLQCFYNYNDFGDPELETLARAMLDVWWADWAQEQIDGVRGGSKNRCYQGGASQSGRSDCAASMAWYYLDVGVPMNKHPGVMCLATSTYRMPPVVMDIALDVEGRGTYVCRSRLPGAVMRTSEDAAPPILGKFPVNRLDPECPAIGRYTFCTPDFILGTTLVDRRSYDATVSQNRWQGVIFAGETNARIYPQCVGLNNGKTYNQHISIQNRGVLITQKLPRPLSKQAGAMRVYFDESLTLTEQDGWIFAEAPTAWAAVRPARGGHLWDDDSWLRIQQEDSPVIMEVASKVEYATRESFIDEILSVQMTIDDEMLVYVSPTGAGDFRFYLESERLPEVDGRPIDPTPGYAFDGPFLRQDWASGVVTIRKGDREIVIDVR